MTNEAKRAYGEAIIARRMGEISQLDGTEPFEVVKPDFYADAKNYSEEVLDTLLIMRESHPPYGLADEADDPVTRLGEKYPWADLEFFWGETARLAFSETDPALAACPYHRSLEEKLGSIGQVSFGSFDGNERGLDTLREKTFPGAWFARNLIVPLVSRMPELKAMHGSTLPVRELAHNSVGLLKDPLNHPQQWAAAFILSLQDISIKGPDTHRYRRGFLTEDKMRRYTKLSHDHHGNEIIAWAMPTEDFTLPVPWRVISRVQGSEMNATPDNTVAYARGTRLGDIAFDEPVIGCPGRNVAHYMWHQTIEVAEAEGIWDAA